MDRVNVAGVKSGKEKKPSPVVVAERTKPLSSPVSVTLTPAITAPPGSWTVPESPQEIFWAGSKAGSMSTRASFRKFHLLFSGLFHSPEGQSNSTDHWPASCSRSPEEQLS